MSSDVLDFFLKALLVYRYTLCVSMSVYISLPNFPKWKITCGLGIIYSNPSSVTLNLNHPENTS